MEQMPSHRLKYLHFVARLVQGLTVSYTAYSAPWNQRALSPERMTSSLPVTSSDLAMDRSLKWTRQEVVRELQGAMFTTLALITAFP